MSTGRVPIGHRSTISQPFIVALMTHLAEVAPDHTSLEIGTGSGYQAAILARLAKQVCTVELVAPLAVRRDRRCWATSAMTTRACGSATATRAGRNAGRSTRSLSPRRSGTCRRR